MAELIRANKLGKNVKEYPFDLIVPEGISLVTRTINNESELIKEIDKRISEGNKTETIFDELGIDGVQFADNRTMDIISNYLFYKNAPQALDSKIWFESFIILDGILGARL